MKKLHENTNSSSLAEVSARTRRKTKGARCIWSLDFKPISFDENDLLRPDVIDWVPAVYLRYSLRALDFMKMQQGMHRPPMFSLSVCSIEKSVLGGAKQTFRDYDEFVRVAQESPFYRFLMKTTNISPRLFEIAKNNYGAFVPLAFDIEKYIKECGGDTRIQTQANLNVARMERERREEYNDVYQRIKRGEDPLTGDKLDED